MFFICCIKTSMKKYLLLLFVSSLAFVWCAKPLDTMDFAKISDLSSLQNAVDQVSDDIKKWIVSMEDAQAIVDQLQQKYLELTDTTQKNIEAKLSTLQTLFDAQSAVSYSLPLWAKNLWMSKPQGMTLDTIHSKSTYTNADGYLSTMLVYTWEYTLALQQAKRIADQAGLFVSKDFEKGQDLAQNSNTNYISWLDIDGLTSWIIYVNHELLDMNVETLLSVSVDQSWTLIIETTKYK